MSGTVLRLPKSSSEHRKPEQTAAAQDKVHGEEMQTTEQDGPSAETTVRNVNVTLKALGNNGKILSRGMMVRAMLQNATAEARFECERNQRQG